MTHPPRPANAPVPVAVEAADSLQGAISPISLKKAAAGSLIELRCIEDAASSGRCDCRRGDELGEFAEVLSGGGEEELVSGATGTS